MSYPDYFKVWDASFDFLGIDSYSLNNKSTNVFTLNPFDPPFPGGE